MNKLLQSALERERRILLTSIEKTKLRLNEYEKKNSLKSEEFFDKYNQGIAGDSDEVIDWAGEYQIYLELKSRLDSLEDIVVAH